MKTVSNCIVCKKPLSGKQRSFCSIECKNDYFLSYDALKKRAFERKSRLIGASNGCQRCGYNASLDALSFYDKDGKTLHIDTNVLANSNYEKLVKRVTNAQVLCRNCVEEVQNPQTETLKQVQDDMKENNGKLVEKFNKNLAYCDVKPGQTIVLGVSGGVDSVTMLDLFTKSDIKVRVIVAHLNHGVREEAKRDEIFVQKLVKKLGFEFVSKRIAKPESGNLEENLRDERRKFLLDTAENSQAQFIALAHNANDQAETFIMNAVRGSGPAGLGAMNMSEDRIIRPLLNFSRAEIEAYARQNRLNWHEDETNKDISYDRNYVRHHILPLLARLNPEYLSSIHRTTHLQRQIDEHFKEEAYRLMKETDVERLRRLDSPLLYEVLGLMYEEVRGNRQDLSLAHLQDIVSLIAKTTGTKTLDLPGGIAARRRYDKLDFYRKKAHNVPSTPSTKKLKIGTQSFGTWEITISSVIPAKADGNTLVIDAGLLPHLVIRTRKPGDRIATIGMTGRKRLQDLFVDAKIDRDKREVWPILVDTLAGQILWVPGLAKAKYTNSSKKLLTINIVEAEHETNEKE